MSRVRVAIVKGNILNVRSDAIVLPANTRLREGSGVSTAVFQAAGRTELTKACQDIGSCEEGKAVVTPGFNLNAGYIIHTVVPRWTDGQHNEYERLCASYLAALNAANILGCPSIAFPLLGSGNNGYNLNIAFEIAYQTLQRFEGSEINTAYLVIYWHRVTELVKGKGIAFAEVPEVYVPTGAHSHGSAANGKGVLEQVGEFLGKKENWDMMLDVAKKIIQLVMEIK